MYVQFDIDKFQMKRDYCIPRTCGRTAMAGAAAATTDVGRASTGVAAIAVFTVMLGSFSTTALKPLIGSAAYDTTRREPSGSIRL